jgi:hypothetical protein
VTIHKILTFAAVALVVATSPSLACKGKNVLFEDNFAEVDPAWDVWDQTKIEDGALKITATAGRIAEIFYKADSYEKADICVDAIVPDVTDPKNQGSASLLFEAQSYNDFYALYVSPANGTVSVARLFKNKWLYPVPSRKVDGINTQPGAKNTLRVTLNGARATAYVNEHKIADFRINATEGGGFVGLNVDGGESAPVTWSFKNFKVTDLP